MDRIFVGRIPGIGAVALGGVGIYLPINILFMAVSLLFGGGGAPQAAIAIFMTTAYAAVLWLFVSAFSKG